MDSFAFIIHPIDPKRDVSRKFPFLGKVLTENQIDFFSTYFPPVYISEIEGITSLATGKQIKGWFLACPYTQMCIRDRPLVEGVSKSRVERFHSAGHFIMLDEPINFNQKLKYFLDEDLPTP